MNVKRLVITVFMGSLLSACAAQPRMMPTAEFSPVQPIAAQKPIQPTGAIFTNGRDLFVICAATKLPRYRSAI